MSSSLSIATNTLANVTAENLARNAAALQTSATRLSTGLRINTAADDPSGLAISQGLQAQVLGFDQATLNVQNASNAAAIADGALATTTDLLQRIRALAVEASSDISSTADKANLQTEVSQLILEVNRIAQNTNFNGIALLDGSHAGFQPEIDASLSVTANAFLASALVPATPAGPTTVTAPNYSSAGPGLGPTETLSGLVAGTTYKLTGQIPGGNWFWGLLVGGVSVQTGELGGPFSYTFTATGSTETYAFLSEIFALPPPSYPFVVTGIKATPQGVVAASTGPVGNSALLIATAVAASANFNTTVGGAQGYTAGGTGTLDGTIEVQVINTGTSIAALETFFSSAATTAPASVSSELLAANSTTTLFDNVAVSLGNFGLADVGVTGYIKISQNVAASSNPAAAALNIQSAADEGDTLTVGFAAVDAASLRISNVNVLLSSASSPSLGAEDAIGQIDNALAYLLGLRASLGAIAVRLGDDAGNDQGAAVNYQASESSIADLAVGSETTNFTRLRLLGTIGTTVLGAAETNAKSVLGLFQSA